MARKTSGANTDEKDREKGRANMARGGEFRAARARAARASAEPPAEGATEPGLEKFDLGAALLVVDRSGWVVRSSGWEAALRRPVPARVPPDEEDLDVLLEGIAAAIDDARRLSARAHRLVSVVLERQRFYSVSVVPIGAARDGSMAVLVMEITEVFGLGPREGDAIRQLSHDLRTPLTSMSGAVELLESGRLGRLTDEQVRLLDMLGKGLQMMLSLLDDASARARAAQAAEGRGRATA
ncbi:MAG TPA: histidine kinase dimerization/phospho-acceptor domain-containing protein [Candidatus Polarisedimenticolia bacterium]|jgi:signal transduction histidine kinase|nr:histidine kinase dimerization/phospho-acceptor domain-containing protein [Candidatus Polarisedimenticolia bacterium]